MFERIRATLTPVAAVILGVGILAAAVPAEARHGWHGGRGYHDWHRHWGYGGGYYAPPPVVYNRPYYAPPPVVYSPGLSIHIR